ncbi:GroES-like protein [Eremomyces bilateralis CBS 781.70]|uniref:GroES-like protein n=1 Tax=Eremomyces bilateralis CBS 781.70 TaxID=1392243 RepID=A0A6G1FSQ0_9PEZI|nr:GroES-like protein [Eremomyces bilateralis CBS 781.70]KAF1808783.1 GroES-like protein [Eremomyces bilateralis CBS 781.70]
MAEPQIPKQHKAAVYDKPGSISTEVRLVDTPEPGAGEVLVKLSHSGVCHSDLGVMANTWSSLPYPTQPGQVGGHEGVGEVVKLGPGTESAPIKLGQRVGIKWIAYACGGCLPCMSGRDGLCQNQKISGYYYPGTFQQYAIAPAHYATPIPDGVDSASAAPMLCAGVTVYSGLKKADAKPGNFVVLLGAGGGLGHLGVQLASKGMGYRVIGVDHPSKKDLVLEMGAEAFVGIDENVVERVKALTEGLGAHAVLVLTAANAAYATSVDLLRFGGTVVCVGVPEGKPVAIEGARAPALIIGEKKIMGVAVGTRQDAIEVLDFAARGIVKTHYRTEPLDKLAEVFQEMDDQKLQGRVVIDLNA